MLHNNHSTAMPHSVGCLPLRPDNLVTSGSLYEDLGTTLEEISRAPRSEWSAESSSKAVSFLKATTDFQLVRQTQRANTPATSAQEYYNLSLSIPVLDELWGQKEARFSKHPAIDGKGLSLVPSAIASSPGTRKATALEIATEFEADLPDEHSLTTFHAELDRWRMAATSSIGSQPTGSPTVGQKSAAGGLFPCTQQLLSLIVVLPVTTCSCEQSISNLRQLKTYLRSTPAWMDWLFCMCTMMFLLMGIWSSSDLFSIGQEESFRQSTPVLSLAALRSSSRGRVMKQMMTSLMSDFGYFSGNMVIAHHFNSAGQTG